MIWNKIAQIFTPRKGPVDIQSRFELLREAITGTMSRFYMARDRQTGEIVGLKIIDPVKMAQLEERFRGLKKPPEGEIAIRFQHPNIVRTFEYGWTTKGEPYIVMEYLTGGVLSHLLVAKDPRLEGIRLKIIRQAAEALAVVHEAGFIHHDICPRNLFLLADEDVVKLIDFGLTIPATPEFCRPGNRTGTPDYMAPEVARRQPVDQKLDIFSFGVTAYEILTGQLPWPRGTTALNRGTTIIAVMAHSRPGTDIRQYRPQIHPDLAKAIHACIEPDPNRRCPSMRHFLAMIRKLEHEDIQ
ncbi:MAG: serine/threonine protein kinase [Thermoguttaceae bacterium]|nr:serine/threonine protein kinase [Thermoguttaceae bacterium]MDW8079902.1 serine/threonine-protein kinase [Thermoguttaceae bacterium]